MLTEEHHHFNPKDLDGLLKGYRSFKRIYFQNNKKLYKELQNQQHPKVLLVGCCDSRVDPAILLHFKPGEVFVVRNVANLVTPFGEKEYHGTASALEYGVKVLGVEHIIVLGHSHCGGIGSIVDRHCHDFECLEPWLACTEKQLQPVLNQDFESMEKKKEVCEKASVVLSLENLLSFPWIKERVLSEDLEILGWYFDFTNGHLYTYDSEKRDFIQAQ